MKPSHFMQAHYIAPLYTKNINGTPYSIILVEKRNIYGLIIQEIWSQNIQTGKWKFLGYENQ